MNQTESSSEHPIGLQDDQLSIERTSSSGPQRLRAMMRVLGVIVGLSSLTKLPSMLLGWIDGDGTEHAFLSSFALSFSLGVALWWPNRRGRYQLRLRDGFLVVTLTWVAASLVSAVPFMYAPPHLSFTQAVFEATSGLTTTGATVIVGLDFLPRSVLLYRQVLQFLGGIGIVVLAVAILPMLKIGGTQLFRAESSGMSRDNKLTPRIAETARALWWVYVGLTALCAAAYWIGGMSLFDAVCHALTTVSTAGFSTHDASFGYWNSPLLDAICIVFMLLGSMNFALHFIAWRHASIRAYFNDSELRAFLRIVVAATLLIATIVWAQQHFSHPAEAFRRAAFQTVANLTTTGFATDSFSLWPGPAPLLLVLLAFVGGCSGSTAGGLKVARVLMVLRQGLREVRQLIHPKGTFLVKLNGRQVADALVLSVSGFITLWVSCFVLLMLGFNAAGLDLGSSFGATAATITNLGPGLGAVANHFADVSNVAVWMGTVGMLLGRLEVFSILVLLSPMFWRE